MAAASFALRDHSLFRWPAACHGLGVMHRDSTAADCAALSDVELVARLLGRRAARPFALAERLIHEAGGVEGLLSAGPAQLAEAAGIRREVAQRLVASAELGRRIQERMATPRASLATPDAVAAWFTPRIGLLDHEQMWVVSVDGRNRLRGARRVAQGGAHGLSVSAREILRAALADAASGFLLVHNHPSGCAEPSDEDLAMTELVARAADVVGVVLIDHVVVTAGGGYISMLELGCLDARSVSRSLSAPRGRGSWPRGAAHVFALHDGQAAAQPANQEPAVGRHAAPDPDPDAAPRCGERSSRPGGGAQQGPAERSGSEGRA
jgi:DNA repair protein RadC